MGKNFSVFENMAFSTPVNPTTQQGGAEAEAKQVAKPEPKKKAAAPKAQKEQKATKPGADFGTRGTPQNFEIPEVLMNEVKKIAFIRSMELNKRVSFRTIVVEALAEYVERHSK